MGLAQSMPYDSNMIVSSKSQTLWKSQAFWRCCAVHTPSMSRLEPAVGDAVNTVAVSDPLELEATAAQGPLVHKQAAGSCSTKPLSKPSTLLFRYAMRKLQYLLVHGLIHIIHTKPSGSYDQHHCLPFPRYPLTFEDMQDAQACRVFKL